MGKLHEKLRRDVASEPFRSLKEVTADDDNDLPDGACRGLLVTADGDLTIVADDDATVDAVTFPVVAGQIVPVRTRRVMEATTATVLAGY